MAIPNKDEFEGGATQFGGEVKEKIGEITGDEDLEREGKTEQIKGKMQEGFGTLKHKLGEALEDASVKIYDAGDRLRD